MQSTGIVRNIDALGRIVVPSELRNNLRIKDGQPMEIFTKDGHIILRKYKPDNTNADIIRGLESLTYKCTHHEDAEIIERAIELLK